MPSAQPQAQPQGMVQPPMGNPLQMAQAYAVFANGGLKVVPYAIDTIQNSQDEVIYKAKITAKMTENGWKTNYGGKTIFREIR